MKIELITLSDMGASRLKNLITRCVLNRQANAKMGEVKERRTPLGFIESRMRIEIPGDFSFSRAQEWIAESIRYTYGGAGFVVFMKSLEDTASLAMPDLIDESEIPTTKRLNFVYGARQTGSRGLSPDPIPESVDAERDSP